VVGITGSVGKTSAKDICRALLPMRVHASRENFNTEIGLPLAVLSAPAGTEVLVLEMGMRGPGQIAELTAILLGLQSRILGGQRRFTTVSGKGHPPRVLRLGRWRYATLAYALTYIAITVVLPYLVLLYAAFITRWGLPPVFSNLTLDHVTATFDPALSVRSALFNSFVLAIAGASL
jgi:hypothetical protein